MNIYIIITSAHQMVERRLAVRSTWMTRLPPGVTARFVVGDGPKIKEPSVVQLSAPDSYDGLWCKVREAIRYSLKPGQPEYDYLCKCDDDTYLVPERLESAIRSFEIQKPHYIGTPTSHNPEYFYGNCYLLSHWLAEKIAVAPDCPDPAWGEDGWVGAQARQLVKLCPTPRFNIERDIWPTQDNDIITTHGARTVEEMFKYHARYMLSHVLSKV